MRPVLGAYHRAADAVVAVTRDFGDDDWFRPSACAGWTNLDVAGHVLAVVRWHHSWLEASLHGATEPPWPASELPRRNAEELAVLDVRDGPLRVAQFARRAYEYAERITPLLDAPYVYPGGRVTVGVHAELVVGEWNLHAWDIDQTHRPIADDAALVRATWLALHRPIDADADAWHALLAASGRA